MGEWGGPNTNTQTVDPGLAAALAAYLGGSSTGEEAPNTRTLNGKQGYGVYGWNPATQQFDIYYGNSQAPRQTTYLETGTDYITEQELINEGFVKVGPSLYERYDGTRIQQYQGNRQQDGSIKYQLKFVGAPPKGYKGPVAGKPTQVGTDGEAIATPTAVTQQFPKETHGTSTPEFGDDEIIDYQWNSADTNTSYSKGATRDYLIKEERERKKALAEPTDPFAAANGGHFVAEGPQLITDMSTGLPSGVFGGAGREMATFTPLDQPSAADVMREQQIAQAVDPFAAAALTGRSRAFNGQSSPEIAMAIANEQPSANLRPWPWERDPITGEWRIMPEVLARAQAGMYPGGIPGFAIGGTMTTTPELDSEGLVPYDQRSFGAPSIPAEPLPSPEPVPVPLPRPEPVPQDPFRARIDGWRNFQDDFWGTGPQPITDPMQSLPPDIQERYAQLQSFLRQRSINAYKYAQAGLPQPPMSSEEIVAEQQAAAIRASAPTFAQDQAIGPFRGLVNQQARSGADSRLRGQLGMQSPGQGPGEAPSVGSRPLPADPFALVNAVFRRN